MAFLKVQPTSTAVLFCCIIWVYFCTKRIMQFNPYHHNNEVLQQRINQILQTDQAHTVPPETIRLLFSCMDLTSLDGTDNVQRISELCTRALNYRDADPGIAVAAVCLYMPFISLAKSMLEGTGIAVATVACGFPSGQIPLGLKLDEVRFAVAEGADEIDMVISRGSMLAGDEDTVYREISMVKEKCGRAHLKVILETGELIHPSVIRRASELALLAGADFLKTSTGKINPAATPLAALVMLDTIAEYYAATGRKVGFKPAGGIVSLQDAFSYFQLVHAVAGTEWLNPSLFRIGASRLAENLRLASA
jgi:deoxyribose-phosphate aldolase